MKYKNSKVTPEESQEIRNLSLSGLTVAEICRITWRSKQCVYEHVGTGSALSSEPKYLQEEIAENAAASAHREKVLEISRESAEMHRNDRYYLAA